MLLCALDVKEGGVSRCGQFETLYRVNPILTTWPWSQHVTVPALVSCYSVSDCRSICFLTSVSDSSFWNILCKHFFDSVSSVLDSSSGTVSCHQSLTPVSCHQSLTPVLLILVISLWLQFSWFLSSVFDSSFLFHQSLTPVLLFLVINLWLQFSCFLWSTVTPGLLFLVVS